jgi:hypothetical protein
MNELENPYSSPNSGPSVAKPEHGSPVKAVLLGVLVDLGGSLVAGIVLLIVAILVLGLRGTPVGHIEGELTNIAPDSWFSIAAYLVGCLFSFLGGYVCARVAKRSEYKVAGIVAFISGMIGFSIGLQQESLYLDALLSLLGVLCVMLGANRGVARNKKKV